MKQEKQRLTGLFATSRGGVVNGGCVVGGYIGRHSLSVRLLGVKISGHQSRKLNLAEAAKSVNAVMIAS